MSSLYRPTSTLNHRQSEAAAARVCQRDTSPHLGSAPTLASVRFDFSHVGTVQAG